MFLLFVNVSDVFVVDADADADVVSAQWGPEVTGAEECDITGCGGGTDL